MNQNPGYLIKTFITIVITITLSFACTVRTAAQCGGVILGGYHLEGDYRNLDDRNHYYVDAPLHDDRWKMFRFEAENNGQATCADVFMWSLVGDDHANDELWVALYEDTGIQEPDPYGGYAYMVGALKAWGYLSGDIWAPGQYRHYNIPLTHVETTRDIIAGENYWITVQSSDGADVRISRGRERLPDCANADKRGAEYPRTGIAVPPPGSEFNDQGRIYEDNCYEWSVWQSDGSITNTTTTTTAIIVECTEDSDCPNDRLYCNGEELCSDQNSRCRHSGNPCPPDLFCDEENDVCLEECTTTSHCEDGLYCNGEELCVDGNCEAGTPPLCPEGMICDDETNSCEPAPSIQLTPESWYQSRWLLQIVFLSIEGSGTHFDKSVTEIALNPAGTALLLPRVVDENTISCFGILMTRWMAPVDSIDVTVTTGPEELTEQLEIKLLPFMLLQEKHPR